MPVLIAAMFKMAKKYNTLYPFIKASSKLITTLDNYNRQHGWLSDDTKKSLAEHTYTHVMLSSEIHHCYAVE